LKLLRAYVCNGSSCGFWAMDLTGALRKMQRPVLVMPGEWLEDPTQADAAWRRQVEEDATIIRTAGVKAFPVLVEGDLSNNQVITEADWKVFVEGHGGQTQ